MKHFHTKNVPHLSNITKVWILHFWVGFVAFLLHPPKSDDKMKKVGNWSELHS